MSNIAIAPVTKKLHTTALAEGWFEDKEENWLMGFGKDELGAVIALESFKRYVKRDSEEEDFGLFGIYENDTPLGYVTLEYLGDIHKATRLFIFISPYQRSRGVGKQALFQILEAIFDGKVHRVEVVLLSINKGVIQFYRSFGFTQEGVKRDSYWMGINSFNQVILRLLRPEWNRKKDE